MQLFGCRETATESTLLLLQPYDSEINFGLQVRSKNLGDDPRIRSNT